VRNGRPLGVLALIASPFPILVGYGNLPDAHTCATINAVSQSLGQSGTCSSTPGAGYWVLAAVLAAVGLVLLLTRVGNHNATG
jgi:hypothetical protein